MLLETLGASMLKNILIGKHVTRVGKGVVRVERGHKNMDHMDKSF